MLGRRTKSKWAHIAVIFSCLAVIIASMAPIAGAATTTAASTGSTVTNSENPYVLVAAKGGMGGQQSNNNNNNNNNNPNPPAIIGERGGGGDQPASDVGTLAAMVAPKPVAVAPFEKHWVIYFDFDDDTIRPQDVAILEDVVKTYKERPKSTVELAGHTDSMGTDEYNVDLSWRRVRSAQNYLLAKGITETTIMVAAHGEASPAATNDTPEGRSLNRRVTIHLKQL